MWPCDCNTRCAARVLHEEMVPLRSFSIKIGTVALDCGPFEE